MAEGHRFAAYLPGGASGGILPAAHGRPAARFRRAGRSTAASSARARSSCCPTATISAQAARNLLRFFRDESCGQCTPCRVGTAKAARAAGGAALGPRAAGGTGAGDGGRLDLRPRPGGDEPGAQPAALLSGGACHDVASLLDGREVEAAPGETIWAVAQRDGRRDPASLPPAEARLPPRRQLPRLPGGGGGRAHPRRLLHPRAARRAWWCAARPARARSRAAHGLRTAAGRHARRRARDATARLRALGRAGSASPASRFAPRRCAAAPPTSRIPRWPCSSTPASQCGLCERACREVQHNDVIGLARRGHGDAVSFDLLRPDGRLLLRRLRRMRAGLPDRRAAAEVACSDAERASRRAAEETTSRASAPIAASAARSGSACATAGSRRWSGREEGPANQGRLCVKGRFGFDYLAPPGPADDAAGPHRRRGEGPGRLPRSRAPRARSSARRAGRRRWTRAAAGLRAHPRPARPGCAGRLRLAPRARTRRPICSRSWCAPASAPTTSTTARGSATPPPSPRCWRTSAARAVTAPFTAVAEADLILVIGARPDREPPRRRHLPEGRRRARRGADRHGSARHRPGPLRARRWCASAPARTSRC